MILKSIRARLSVLFSLCLAVLMVAAVAGLIWYSKRSAERSADSLLMATAQRTVIESEEPISAADLIAEEREDIQGTDLAMSIVDENGGIIARTQKNSPGLSAAQDGKWRTVNLKLKNGNTVVVGMPWAQTRGEVREHAIALILLGAFVVVVASAGAWVLVGRALRPIPLLARQAKASSADNLAISLEPPSEDSEMVELVDTLNGLLRRVTETAAAKGRFYSAASHELRTPLQALSGHLELALSRDRTGDEYKLAAEEAYAQTKRLISLTRALLLLYQLDSSTDLPAGEPVDLVDACRRALSHCQPVIDERHLRVDIRAPEEAEIISPPRHIEILVRNLVENAARYASEHGRVAINIAVNTNSVGLGISNDCTAPPNWKSDEMFEPFFRMDASRNAKTGGNGLGLAICKSIADVNGWELSLTPEMQSVSVGLTLRRE